MYSIANFMSYCIRIKGIDLQSFIINHLERKRSNTPAGKEILRKRLEKLENQYEETRNRRMAEQSYEKECKHNM